MPAIGDLTSYFNFSADAKAKLAQHAALLEGSRK
jgi:hypothetical protein